MSQQSEIRVCEMREVSPSACEGNGIQMPHSHLCYGCHEWTGLWASAYMEVPEIRSVLFREGQARD